MTINACIALNEERCTWLNSAMLAAGAAADCGGTPTGGCHLGDALCIKLTGRGTQLWSNDVRTLLPVDSLVMLLLRLHTSQSCPQGAPR